MPNRTVITAGNEPSESQKETLLKALRQKLKRARYDDCKAGVFTALKEAR